MNARRVTTAVLLAGAMGIGAVGCSSDEAADSGAITDLSDIGPDVAKLRFEVQQLREEVRALREEVAALTPVDPTATTTTTNPSQ